MLQHWIKQLTYFVCFKFKYNFITKKLDEKLYFELKHYLTLVDLRQPFFLTLTFVIYKFCKSVLQCFMSSFKD